MVQLCNDVWEACCGSQSKEKAIPVEITHVDGSSNQDTLSPVVHSTKKGCFTVNLLIKGVRTPVEVKGTDLVKKLIDKVPIETGEKVRLLYGGKILADPNATLASIHGLDDGSAIHVMISKLNPE